MRTGSDIEKLIVPEVEGAHTLAVRAQIFLFSTNGQQNGSKQHLTM